MLNFINRPVASPAAARLRRIAVQGVCVGMLAAASVQAAESRAPAATAPVSAPFSQYQNWRDVPLQDWRAANGRVGEIGGWQTYLREAQQDRGGVDPGLPSHQGH